MIETTVRDKGEFEVTQPQTTYNTISGWEPAAPHMSFMLWNACLQMKVDDSAANWLFIPQHMYVTSLHIVKNILELQKIRILFVKK